MKKEEFYAPLKETYIRLKDALNGEKLERIIELALEVHAMVHPSVVSEDRDKTVSDYVLDYMREGKNKEILVPRMYCDINLEYAGTDRVPMCWQFWHTYRIEDLVSNLLMTDGQQIFDEEWKRRMNVQITDTGNALESDEVIAFATEIDESALEEYIIKVSENTRKILANLTLEQLKSRPSKEQLDRIVKEGGLIQDKRSIWLLDYWGGLTVSEMILTPLTDHHMMHLPTCLDRLPIWS